MLRHSKISVYKIKKILKCFCVDLQAVQTAKMLGLNRKTVDRYYGIFREKIMEVVLLDLQAVGGEFECDESYFGAKRVRGKRGRGAGGKTPVFGLLKRDGKVYVSKVKNCSKKELLPIIKGKVLKGSLIHTDSWKAYDSLIFNGYKHRRVHHGQNQFVRGKSHVNGIESFWSFAKRRFSLFYGIPSHKFDLYLKETEFRFNHRSQDLFPIAKKIIFNI
jgi:transposase-like protein